MLESLEKCQKLLYEIRTYLVKRGQSRYKGQTIDIKLKEANDVFEKCKSLLLVIGKSSDAIVIQLGKDIFEKSQELYDEIKKIMYFSKVNRN